MSSTDNPVSGAQQATPPVVETPDVAQPEVEQPSAAVTPGAGTPEAPTAGEAAAPEVALPVAETLEEAAPQAAVPPADAVEETADAATAEEASPAPATGPDEATPPAPGTAAPASPVLGPAVPVPTPAALAPAAESPVSDPSLWGRVDEDGTVYVRTADGERVVGSWQAGEPVAGLAHYARRYDDLATEVSLLEARLKAHTGNPAEIKNKAQALAESIPSAAAVGDLEGLAARARAMVGTADSAAAESRAEKAAARAAQIARKEALAAEAEKIAEESTSWKAAGDRLKAIVEEWKTIRGIDRKTDEALWTRFAAARDAFGRRRGAHFAQLDAQRGEARAAKQELIKEAQRLSTSTEWGPTSAAMRALMDRWKAVPRTGRDGDDDLWKQFRAAQDVFFSARTESDKARTGEEQANQKLKEELLAEAEKLDPSKDLRGAQNALRKIQERYDAIGHVPRGAMRQLEDRMQAVEQKVRGAADAGRVRTAPENPMVTSMRAAVTKAEEQLAKAEAAGDQKRIDEAQANLATRREWLAEAEKSASRR
ncbi:DUF349 domain-containing protein [Candidatus Blastococcus massiliensis]|uniref:DUF349 domain-containing protein n=1 Tax=Candidatus Blastococcus massiliensis TaxID=1470358 RepID=UPI0004BB3EEE|nr:DUF349 domain-containing protein [Candidatus Blastococcus massiliensis]